MRWNMQIVYKKINELKPYKNNPRKNDGAVEYVANSIREFGFKVPIIIDTNNEIIELDIPNEKTVIMYCLKENPSECIYYSNTIMSSRI